MATSVKERVERLVDEIETKVMDLKELLTRVTALDIERIINKLEEAKADCDNAKNYADNASDEIDDALEEVRKTKREF
jgi:hypothetical protein